MYVTVTVASTDCVPGSIATPPAAGVAFAAPQPIGLGAEPSTIVCTPPRLSPPAEASVCAFASAFATASFRAARYCASWSESERFGP